MKEGNVIIKRITAVALGVTLAVAGVVAPQVKAAEPTKAAKIVKCQNVAGTTADTETTSIRLVTGVDSLQYEKVGFEVKIGNNEANTYDTTKVYPSIKANGQVVKAEDFDANAAYLAAIVLTDIPKASYDTGIYVKPYVVTLDGEKVYGTDRYARVCNGYDGSFSVAVRVDETDGIGAGLVFVEYDSENLEYVNYDDGTILEEHMVATVGNQVRCVSNVADVSKDATADGILVNLNFKVKNYDASAAATARTFEVKKSEFCNVAEEDVTIDSLTVDSVKK